jgi:tetratricopeptide (TPR) repeat protein
MTRSIFRTIALATLVSAGTDHARAQSSQGKAFTWTTQSEDAKKMLKELQWRIESFQPVPGSAELGRKIVALDPSFAMGAYYLSAVAPTPAEGERLYREARELAKKNASEGERRFIEAMEPVRTNGGANSLQALPALEKLAADYPGERLPPMILGQILNGNNRSKEAVGWFKKAQAIQTSPRIESFLANDDLFAGRYGDARAKFALAEKQLPAGSVPFPIRFGVTFSHIYEGNTDAAIKSLETYLVEYKAGGLTQQFPEVFIHNAIARINLEAGRYDAALAAYKKGYDSVPGSTAPPALTRAWAGTRRRRKASRRSAR